MTDFPHIPGFEGVDNVQRPVFSLITETTFVGETAPHHHNKAQLMYVIGGVLTLEAAGGIWTVPPHCALWIPGGVSHAGRMAGRIKIASLYIDPGLAAPLDRDCGILFVQPFLRELILRFDSLSPKADMDCGREARLISVLLDELGAAPLEPIHLPLPSDRRLRRLTESMIENPGLRFTIEEWGARVGASNRTLSRLFQRETGMSFVRWRQQLHVGLALQRLAQGELVTNVAGELGYESISAFIAMFRRMLGTTPARYFGEMVSGVPERRERKTLARDEGDQTIVTAANIVPLRRP
ncbi:helix-turn-helix transcriptional regulator [Mesorhizobium sp. RMAD-H1]|uniref:AraC family transcriptional regulator n=1 Tax=Mesorhizobium sp. RMAD-H1 TaxID=2587065 RepID=UPI00160C5D00|nr:helix-turn-helix transcriptional regulator [Mesorhizobium sp. RMAD-H1]MBB2971105.1 AraC-like DNA-binding protein [Mesorhizobium sp. RMAD-H1]